MTPWTRERVCELRGLPVEYARKLLGDTPAEWDSAAIAFKAARMSFDVEIRARAGGPAHTPAQIAALAAGLPIEAADRLRGDTAVDLAADAEVLAAAFGLTPRERPSFDDRIRTRAGRPPAPDNTRRTP